GQRRAELVADVGEERSLGAVDLRQRFRTLAFFLIRASIGYRRRDLRRHQLQEATIQFVELQTRADTHYQETGELMRNVRADRYQDGLTGWISPGPRRHRFAKTPRQILNVLRPPRAHRLGQRPGQAVALVVEVDNRWAGCAARDDTSGPSQARPLSVGIDQVNQREGNVRCVFAEGFRRDGARLFGRLRLRGPGT